MKPPILFAYAISASLIALPLFQSCSKKQEPSPRISGVISNAEFQNWPANTNIDLTGTNDTVIYWTPDSKTKADLVRAGTGWYAAAVLEFHERCDVLGTNDTTEIEKDVWHVVCDKWLNLKLQWDSLKPSERLNLLETPPKP